MRTHQSARIQSSPHPIKGLSTAAPDHVRDLLTSKDWTSDVGTLAIEVVKTQLSIHETRQDAARDRVDASESRVPSLFDSAALKVAQSIGDDPEEDAKALSSLPPGVLSRAAWKIENIPYLVFCMARQSHADEDDIDEWVLRNEKWLRDSSVPTTMPDSQSPSKHHRGEDGQKVTQASTRLDWTRGLVRLSSHAGSVFPDSVLTDACRVITRPTSLLGFKILDGRRSPVIRIQPSVDMFAKTFEEMTSGLLKGLKWDNIFIAGGIVLGALLCTKDKDATNTPEQWKNSDVDLYIHGLGPIEANKKVEHIFDIFKANLPAGAPVLVVRNSKTITFFSKYPLRRIQVVLKLVGSPKDVLLNFDLDICAVGWDGNEVWMLPRAARALETGYTVFTMDLINGHYLGDRRATQEQRVFKYADKGYGIRILPSYLEELQAIKNDSEKWESLDIANEEALDIEKIAQGARAWTTRAIAELTGRPFAPLLPQNQTRPTVSHSALQERCQISEDPPRRSCMSGLNLFMRHVALWEHELAGDIFIKKDDWAAQMYDTIYTDQFNVSYNDAPDYSWDEEFTSGDFITKIKQFNQSEISQLISNLWELFGEGLYWSIHAAKIESTMQTLLVEGSLKSVQRMTHANSVQEILQSDCDIVLPLWLPRHFVEFVDELIPDKAQESGVQDYSTRAFTQGLKTDVVQPPTVEALVLVLWHITSVTMWQQLDRAIDEVHEVLWSFHHANAGLSLEVEDRLGLLLTQFGRRAIRKTAQHEFAAFARWVGRKPARITDYNGPLAALEEDRWEEEED